jgi:hypothetical protein
MFIEGLHFSEEFLTFIRFEIKIVKLELCFILSHMENLHLCELQGHDSVDVAKTRGPGWDHVGLSWQFNTQLFIEKVLILSGVNKCPIVKVYSKKLIILSDG